MTGAWKQWEGHVINSAFELKKYLGGSEFSAVFLTEDHGQPPKPAAIKLVAADVAVADLQLSRWEMARELQHPNLVRILQTGRCQLDDRDMIFTVMEYGQENLAEIIFHRPLTTPEARAMLTPILDALASLHSQGFVYGHLKPTNILAVNDQLKLASEGKDKDWEDATESGPAIPGPYDPPEMAGGARSPAADVWSLGMVLVEVLTQRLPYWNQNNQPDPVLPENLPGPFFDIVRGCLRRDPKRRLTIAEIAALLYHEEVPPQQPATVADRQSESQKSLAASAPAVMAQKLGAKIFNRPTSDTEVIVRRFAILIVIALPAIFILLAGLSLLRDHPETKSAAIKPEQQLEKPDPRRSSSRTSLRAPSARNISPSTVSPGKKTSALPPAPARGVGPDAGTADSAVIRQVLPDIPQAARNTIRGILHVNVRVKVDSSGNVVEAGFDSPPPSRYIAGMALEAAQNWKFSPHGPAAGRGFIVHFEFTTTGTRAFATRAL
jgi:TonB family protein